MHTRTPLDSGTSCHAEDCSATTRAGGLAGKAAIFLCLAFASQAIADAATGDGEDAREWATGAFLNGNKSELVDKRVGPIRLISTDESGKSTDLVSEAVAELNDAFGYGKLALSESEKAIPEDDAIVLYIGSKSAGRRLIERFGVSSPRAFRGGAYYYWYDDREKREIKRGVVALDEALPEADLARQLRRYLLGTLGYTGSTGYGEGILSEQRRSGSPREPRPTKMLSEFDGVMLKFCDNHVPPAAKWWEIENIVQEKWPDFSAAYRNPAPGDSAAARAAE